MIGILLHLHSFCFRICGKVDFEGYINFNDAGAEYKFTSFQNGREYAGATAGTIATSGILKFQLVGYYKMG
jgi:hypothetical protein